MAAPRKDRHVSGQAATEALNALLEVQASRPPAPYDVRQDWGHEDPRINERENGEVC